MTAGSQFLQLISVPPLKDSSSSREPCLFQAERNLPCGAIVREQAGKIIAKITILTTP